MICPAKVSRSTMAAQSRGSVKVLVHYAQALVMTGMPVDRGLVCGFGRVWAA